MTPEADGKVLSNASAFELLGIIYSDVRVSLSEKDCGLMTFSPVLLKYGGFSVF